MNRASILSLVAGAFLCVVSGCSSGNSSGSSQQQSSNPVPAVTTITPTSLSAGSGPQALAIGGSGFVNASTAYFNGSALQTSFNSATSLQATVPAAMLASGQAAVITVTTPAPGGGSSNPVSFAVTAPTPVLTSLTPSYLLQGTTSVLLITGTGFEANSSVLLNGTAHSTNFVSSTSLQVPLSTTDTQSVGSAQVAVNNPGPGGSTSAASSFVIYPVPSIASLAPATVIAGTASLTLSVTGSNFSAGSVVLVDGVTQLTTFVSSTTLQATVSAAALSSGRVAAVTVHNAAPAVADSAPASLQVTNPAPALTFLSPAVAATGQAATITVSGSGFVSGSNVLWNGSARTTTYVSGILLKVALTAADLQTAGTGQITVSNAAPGGGTSAALSLTIVTPPTLNSLSPSSLQATTQYSSTMTTPLTLTGSNFAPNAFGIVGGFKLIPTSVSATQMVLALPSNLTYNAGAESVSVVNPGTPTFGVASQALTLNIINPSAPFTISPSSAPVGAPSTTITLNGGGFFADSVVQWNGNALATKFSSSYTLTATIPATLLTALGTAVINVSTPENLGQATPTQGFSTYVGLQVNDLVWNPVDGLLYATVPGTVGQGLGNSLVGIDPNTGTVQRTIFVGSEPNRVAISTDGTQAFVGLNGAGAYRQVNLVTGVAGVQVTLGGGQGVYDPPFTAASLAAVPGQPNSVAVYATSGIVTIYDAGVPRAKTSGNASYFGGASGSLSFGSTASTVYLSNGSLHAYTVDSSGIGTPKVLSSSNSGTGIQYDKGRLYTNIGTVFDATTGAQLGQFSAPSAYSSTPVAAQGPVASDSSLNRAFVLLSNGVSVFDETSFNLLGNIPSTLSNAYSYSNLDLIRWGQNGLAFHNGNQLVIFQSALVKDNSGTPVDLSVTAQVPASSSTGTLFSMQFQVANSGANAAAGVTLSFTLPASLIPGQIAASQGVCTGTGTVSCDLGGLAAGASTTVTVNGTPTMSGALQVTAVAGSQSFDSNTANNQATATTTVSGSAYNPSPTLTALSPNLAATGSSGFTLTVTGSGFSAGSVVNWNGSALPTTFISGSSLSALVDATLLKSLGWATVNVSSPAPGGGTSAGLTETLYSLIPLPANAMVYDPFTRKLWTTLPSSSTSPAGNSLVTLDPSTGVIGTPIQVGSEPTALAETSSGNFLYVGVSGAKSLSRFDMLTQKVDATIPLISLGYGGGTAAAANAVVTIPGVDTSVAVPNIGILDFTGTTATVRPGSALGYSDAVFTDSGHAYTFDNYSTGAEFYRYTVDATGVHSVDGTTLLGMGGFQGSFAIENGIGYGASGGIFNPTTTPPSQIATMPLGAGPYGTGLGGGGVIPYTAESKSFNIAYNSAGTWLVYAERFDTQHFQLEDQILLPTGNAVDQRVSGTRWGQDGLAYLITAGLGGSAPSRVMLLRGPFVLPAEAAVTSAPTLASVGQGTIAVGSANQRVTVKGTGFLPGASVVWNGVVHDTTFTDGGTLSVAVAASELSAGATVSVTCRNPGSPDSNAVSVSIR